MRREETDKIEKAQKTKKTFVEFASLRASKYEILYIRVFIYKGTACPTNLPSAVGRSIGSSDGEKAYIW